MNEATDNTRRHDLDALRATAMLLGIALHLGLSLTPFPWPIQDTHQSKWFGLFFFAVHGFRMPVFFLLSGFFTAMLWRNRGLTALIRHRTKRVLVPLLLSSVTILPLLHLLTMAAVRQATDDPIDRPLPVEINNLWLASALGDMQAIRECLKKTDVNQLDPAAGQSALATAALCGQTHAAQFLLDHGADINRRNQDQGTPLHNAAFLGQIEVATLLIERGADLQATNGYGQTPAQVLNVDWETTRTIAQWLKIPVDKETVLTGRQAIQRLVEQVSNGDSDRMTDSPTDTVDRNVAAWFFSPSTWRRWTDEPTLGHLWFLAHLCWLLIAFVGYAWLASRFGWQGLPRTWILTPCRYVWLLPLTCMFQWWMKPAGFGPDTAAGVLPKPSVLIYYGVFFFVGALYWDSHDEQAVAGRWWGWELPLALFVIWPVGMELSLGTWGWSDALPLRPYHEVMSICLQAAYAWMMTFALIGVAHRFFARERRWLRFLSDSSYWQYLIHLPLVFWSQMLVRQWNMSPFAKFALLLTCCSAVLLISYRYLVRYTWLGRLLNGPRNPAGDGPRNPVRQRGS